MHRRQRRLLITANIAGAKAHPPPSGNRANTFARLRIARQLLLARSRIKRRAQQARAKQSQIIRLLLRRAVHNRCVQKRRQLIHLLARTQTPCGGRRANKFQAILSKGSVKRIVSGHGNGKALAMRPQARRQVAACRRHDTALWRAYGRDGRVGNVVIEKLAPLGEHCRDVIVRAAQIVVHDH